MRGAVLVVEDDLAEICDKGPRTHTMNASREREFFCWLFFISFLSSFLDSNFVYKSKVGGIVEARESGEKK